MSKKSEKPDYSRFRRRTAARLGALAVYVSENPGKSAREIADALGWTRRIKEIVFQRALEAGVVRAEYKKPPCKMGGRRRNVFFVGERLNATPAGVEFTEREGV